MDYISYRQQFRRWLFMKIIRANWRNGTGRQWMIDRIKDLP